MLTIYFHVASIDHLIVISFMNNSDNYHFCEDHIAIDDNWIDQAGHHSVVEMCKSGIVDQDLEMRGFPTNSQHKTTVRGKWIICSEDLLLAPIWVVPRVENHRSVAFVEAWVNMQSYIRMGVHLTALLQIYVKPTMHRTNIN